jgi:hypothetical protein
VAFLKRAEREGGYDRDADFTPFSLKTWRAVHAATGRVNRRPVARDV